MAQVSRAAYYQWQEGRGSARQVADAALTAAIRAIHAASRGQYGVPRVLAELRAQGYDVGRKRVARLMAAAGLRGRRPPRWVRTTTPEPTPPAIPDRVHGEFVAAAPDVLWVGGITYVRTWEGWLYLATVLDVFSRRVIGWAVADHLRTTLVCDALRMAVATRGGHVAGVIFHSDRGCQLGFNRSSQHGFYVPSELNVGARRGPRRESASRASCVDACSTRARRRRGLRGRAGAGRCPLGSIGAEDRWCARSPRVATGCADHRSRSPARCRYGAARAEPSRFPDPR